MEMMFMVRDASVISGETPLPMGTGRLGFELFNDRGWSVGTGEFILRMDTVAVWVGGRSVAVMHRDLFSDWLFHQAVPLEVDDVVWSSENGVTCLAIDGRRPCSVSKDAIRTLSAVI